MTPSEQRSYDSFGKDHPWLNEIKMTDDELRTRIEKDLGEGYLERYWATLYNDHWSWVCIAVWKHFYEYHEFAETGSDYLDGQNEGVIDEILSSHGENWDGVKTIREYKRTQ